MDFAADMARDPATSSGRLNPSPSTVPVVPDAALTADHARALEEWLGGRVGQIERIGGGRNSRVYRVRTATGERAAKFYFGRTADGRDRLQVEYSAFDFLWRRGVRCIPQPVSSNAARQVALYEYIAGEPVDPGAASAGDIDRLAAFVGQLKAIAGNPDSRSLGAAAEAFFTVGGVIGNIAERHRRIRSVDATGASHDALRQFLAAEFEPAFARLADSARSRVEAGDPELSPERRTLSPSDLGFHNAVRKPDGKLVFLDFEYFGWDDPAKTLSDALLHPRMGLSGALRSRLASRIAAVFDRDPGWRRRVEAVYPLFALKWCMILLNEFRPEQLERRRFVDNTREPAHAIQMRQLDAARNLLRSIAGEHPRFPFW